MHNQKRKEGEAICDRLVEEMHALGFGDGDLGGIPEYSKARFHLSQDPYSGGATLVAEWGDEQGLTVGSLKFHADGSFYAEYDVILPHPGEPRWFVEGVIAWGKDAILKSEPKLLPAGGY